MGIEGGATDSSVSKVSSKWGWGWGWGFHNIEFLSDILKVPCHVLRRVYAVFRRPLSYHTSVNRLDLLSVVENKIRKAKKGVTCTLLLYANLGDNEEEPRSAVEYIQQQLIFTLRNHHTITVNLVVI